MRKNFNILLSAAFATTLCLTGGLFLLGNKITVNAAGNNYSTDNTLTFEKGASIRISEPSGIRFMMKADKLLNVDKTAFNNSEVGMIIVPAKSLDGLYVNNNWTKDIFEHLKTSYGKEKIAVSQKFEYSNVYQKDGENVLSGSIVNIKENHYTWDYQAVVYQCNDTQTIYSAPSDMRTIAQVADVARYDDKITADQKIALTQIVDLSTSECDIAHGLDLSKILINETVTEAKIGKIVVSEKPGENKVNFINFNNGTKYVSPENRIANSNKKQVVSVSLSNGTTRDYNTTIWSSIIKIPQDLLDAHNYEITTKTAGGKARKKSGCFKLANDIDMAGNIFNPENRIGIVDNTVYGGFEGIFDGQGHKITNLKFPDINYNMGLIYAMTKNSVVKNLSLDCLFIKAKNSGVITAGINSGRIENITLTVKSIGYIDNTIRGGAIVGTIYKPDVVPSIEFENILVTYEGKQNDYWKVFSALGVINNSYSEFENNPSWLTYSNINIIGFNKLSGVLNSMVFTSIDEMKKFSTCTNVNVYATIEDFNNSQNN